MKRWFLITALLMGCASIGGGEVKSVLSTIMDAWTQSCVVRETVVDLVDAAKWQDASADHE